MAYAKKIATPAQRIKEILALRRMTQTQLSEITGLSKPVISSYVTSKYQPKPDSLARLSAALGVDEYWLAGYDVPMTKNDTQAQDESISPIGEIIKTARLKQNLSQEQLGDMLGVGKSCISKWERGAVTDLKRSSMLGLNEILRIPIEDLLAATHDDDEQCESRVIFAENLAFYLQQTGETQKSIAEVIGVSAPTVNEWLKAKKYPRPEKLEKLARYFGVSVAVLIERHGQEDCTTHTNDDDSSDSRSVFAKNLSYYIQQSGKTQKEIADELGVASSSFNNWAVGNTYPRPEKMEMLAEYFGVTVPELIGDHNNSSALPNERTIMAQNINYYMAVRGITRKQLCEALGFKYNTLSDWLQGEKYPRIEKIVAMAQYFGCDKADLIEERDRSKSQPPIILDSEVLELLALYQRCDEEQKRCIKQMLKYITG